MPLQHVLHLGVSTAKQVCIDLLTAVKSPCCTAMNIRAASGLVKAHELQILHPAALLPDLWSPAASKVPPWLAEQLLISLTAFLLLPSAGSCQTAATEEQLLQATCWHRVTLAQPPVLPLAARCCHVAARIISFQVWLGLACCWQLAAGSRQPAACIWEQRQAHLRQAQALLCHRRHILLAQATNVPDAHSLVQAG